MASCGSKGYIEHIDDPMTIIVSETEGTTVGWATSKDSGTALVRAAAAAGKPVHYAGALAAGITDFNEFCSNNLIFFGQNGTNWVEILLQLSAVSDIAFNFGFGDDVLDDSNTLPVELSTTTFTLNATNVFCGLVYDTNADNDEVHCIWADDAALQTSDSTANVDGKSLRLKGAAPTASKWIYMKVEIVDRGSGNGLRAIFTYQEQKKGPIQRTFNTTVDRDVALCYYLGVENRSASATPSIFVASPNWRQSIPDMA